MPDDCVCLSDAITLNDARTFVLGVCATPSLLWERAVCDEMPFCASYRFVRALLETPWLVDAGRVALVAIALVGVVATTLLVALITTAAVLVLCKRFDCRAEATMLVVVDEAVARVAYIGDTDDDGVLDRARRVCDFDETFELELDAKHTPTTLADVHVAAVGTRLGAMVRSSGATRVLVMGNDAARAVARRLHARGTCAHVSYASSE